MQILVALELDHEQELGLLADNVHYRPDLEVRSEGYLASALRRISPSALITRNLPSGRTLREWRTRVGEDEAPVLVHLPRGDSNVSQPATSGNDVIVLPVDPDAKPNPETVAFQLLEGRSSGRWPPEPEGDAKYRLRKAATASARSVAMVGAGIVNLITAYLLSRSGYQVTVFDGAPDPSASSDWPRHGCTFGGGDARMFSYTEARQHHYRYGLVDANTQTDFRRRVGEGGWLCTPAPDLGRNDEEWIREFERMPQWLAGQYDQDIVRMNKRSYQGWLALMASDPDLFADVGFRERLFRIYSTQEQLEKAKLRESDYGSLQGILDRAALARECPSLEKAIATGAVAGGLEVAGFSVNVHSFGLRLMRRIGSLGGTFRWNESVQRVAWSGGAVVAGLHLRDGSLLTADHYVLSPGAYGDGLLEGTASHGKIAGMVGMWLTIPNDPPRMEVPLKISRSGFGAPGAAEGANAIPGKTPEGQDVLHLSSGHGYVGVQRKPLSAQALEELARAVEQTAAVYFKDKYEALSPNDLQRPYRYCIRPWTPSGLGLFEAIPANDGGTLVVAGGHSTGGFAQAPVVAEAVLDALSGRRHEMASIYHPRRLERFLA